MSDNVAITPGSGATVAADNISGALHQRVKLTWGVDGSAVDASASNPLPVTGSLSLTGEDHIGQVGGETAVIRPTITVSTTPAYSVGDVVGGSLTLTSAMRISGGTGVLQSISLIDHDNEKPALDVLIYDSALSGTFTDNAAPTWNNADSAKFLGRVQIQASDWVTINNRAYVTRQGLGIPMAANGSADLRAVLINQSTPTFTNTGDLSIAFGFLRD